MIVAVVLLSTASIAASLPSTSTSPTPKYFTNAPWGYTDFCSRYEGECIETRSDPQIIALTPDTWARIVAVHREVQNSIEQVTDQEHWGVSEQWDYPTDGKGDCEDFVLLKRRMLVRSGLPDSALLITVVRLPDGSGHAILLVRTDRGDFVLDNLSNTVTGWAERGYSYVKRQSAENPNHWVMLKRVRNAPVRVAGRR